MMALGALVRQLFGERRGPVRDTRCSPPSPTLLAEADSFDLLASHEARRLEPVRGAATGRQVGESRPFVVFGA